MLPTLSASRLRPRSRGEENPGGSTFSFQPSPVVALDHALHRSKGLSAVPTPRGQERGGIEVAPRFPGADQAVRVDPSHYPVSLDEQELVVPVCGGVANGDGPIFSAIHHVSKALAGLLEEGQLVRSGKAKAIQYTLPEQPRESINPYRE